MPRHSPYALTYFSLHGLHNCCTRHTGYELDLCYLAYYYLSYFICAGPEGPAHPLLSNMSKNIPPPAGLSRRRGIDPRPGPPLVLKRRRASVSHRQNFIIKK